MAIQVTNIAGTSYTIVANDDEKLLRFTSATAVTVTVPDDLVEGHQCICAQAGAGQVNFIAGGTTTFVDDRTPSTAGTGSYLSVTAEQATVFKIAGEYASASFLSLINIAGSGAPDADNDSTEGYSIGSVWYYVNDIYDCTDASTGAAVWTLRSTTLPSQRLVDTASPTAMLTTDGTILFDSDAATISIDLPAASVGKVSIPFKDIGCNSSVNNITINRAGSDTIVDSATGQTSTIISSNGFSGYFLSNGVDTWYLL